MEDSKSVDLWLEAARRGQPEALGELLQTCRQYLLLVASQELENDLQAKAGASDLVQETFLEAQRDFIQFKGSNEAELLAWLRRILLNNLLNFRRQYRDTEKRQIKREVSLDSSSARPDLGRALEADGATPSSCLAREEQEQALLRALDRLPEHYRQVIVLRHREQRAFDDIGQIMECSAEAARKLWMRALERLQEELDSSHGNA